jgi:metal-responsive CopG/Arc/MetJ family transcriptional regulator
MSMKTAISIPDAIFEAAEETAKRLGISRSRLYTQAVERFVSEVQQADVTERLDQIYSEYSATLDPALTGMQAASLEDEGW